MKKILNTCGECIVQAICKDPCNDFISYLAINLPPYEQFRPISTAWRVRTGISRIIYLGNHIISVEDIINE